MKKPAFTMIELVMVIVVLGILAALALPRMDRDIRQEAADNILSAIRYTQHMALIDNVTNPSNANWQQAFWRFGIEGCSDDGIFYYVASDKSTEGNIDAGEEARDPINGLQMMGLNAKNCESDISEQTDASPSIFLTHKYGIKDGSITFTDCGNSTGKYIGFDQLGRPHRGFVQGSGGGGGSTAADYASVITTDCIITLDFDNASFGDMNITVEKETGYAYISNQKAS